MKLECGCADWKPQMEKINGPIVLQSLRAGRDLYDGKAFKFCPWCGVRLGSKSGVTYYSPLGDVTVDVPTHNG